MTFLFVLTVGKKPVQSVAGIFKLSKIMKKQWRIVIVKIEQILIQPIGQRFNAGTLTVKTCKKTWQVKEVWYHQVLFMDDTGEIPADVKISKYLPLKRGQQVNVIVGMVREAEYLGKPRKILLVGQYALPTITVDEYNSQEEDWAAMRQDEIKGKIRHGLVCAYVQGYTIKVGVVPEASENRKKDILEWQDFIMTGE